MAVDEDAASSWTGGDAGQPQGFGEVQTLIPRRPNTNAEGKRFYFGPEWDQSSAVVAEVDVLLLLWRR